MAAGSGSWRFKLLGAFTLLVVVGWSVLWFIAATVVDRQVDRAQKIAGDAGVMISCADRSVGGFPFRIELHCADGSRAGNSQGTVTLAGLTVVAQVYDPSQLIAQVVGPIEVASLGAVPVAADWDLAHASARLSFRDRALGQVIGEVKNLSLSVGPHAMSVGELDASVRRDPRNPADLDLFVKMADVVPMLGGAASTVAFEGRLGGGAAVLTGQPEAVLQQLAARGLPLTIDAMTFRSGDMEVAAAGELTLAADGLVNGTVDLAIAGWDSGVPYLTVVAPQAGATLTQMLGSVLAYAPETEIDGRKAKRVTLKIVDGQPRLGMVPLPMRLPRIALGG